MPDIVVDTPAGILAFQLLAAKHAIKLEAIGLRHSSGRSVRKHYAARYKLSVRAPAAEVIAAIDKELEELATAVAAANADNSKRH